MCNLSKGVEDRGIAIGREKGREEGRKEGREEGRKEGRKEGREEGRKEGVKKGREEGREHEKKATARRLQKMGMPVEVIAQSCGSKHGNGGEVAL